jgi:hypothetical protein
MKMTFDHFDTQVSPEDSRECDYHMDWNEYVQTLASFDDDVKAELDASDMRVEQAEAERVVMTMRQLDGGPAKFA